MATAQMARLDVDLHDLGVFGIELPPGEIRAEHQQRVTVAQGMIARLIAQYPGHAYVVRVVVFEGVLAARSVSYRRLENLGHTKNLIMCTTTTCPAIDSDLLARIYYGGDFVQIGIGGAYDWIARMHGERYVVVDVGMRDVDRDDQYRHSALRDCCLAGHHGLAPCLFGGQDHVTIDAAAPVYRLEVDLLGKIEPQFVANDLTGDQNDGRAIAVRLDDAVDEMQAAGTAASGDRGEGAG